MRPDPDDILYRYWGFSGFRPLQREVITDVLAGRDTLAVMPTGAGKSVCFQVPPLCTGGLCLVITPLISLMRDQVAGLREKGVAAAAVHSGLHPREAEKILQHALSGDYRLLYVSPERLQARLFLDYLPDIPVSLLTVDEAHCISQWGYDFRPAYLRIGALRALLPRTPVLALTATATPEIREEIQEKLLFREKNVRVSSFSRPNLSYAVFREESKTEKAAHILQHVPGSSLIFCKSRSGTRETAARLRSLGLQAEFYHAGLDGRERHRRQQDWSTGKTRIMVCTSAFGMGIDKADVRTVIHYDMPESPEAYYQQAGRAGRDGAPAYAVLLLHPGEPGDGSRTIGLRFPSLENIRSVYRALVSYLQVPAGCGEGQSFDFDLEKFLHHFRLNGMLVTQVLRILEQEGILSLSERVRLPSRICFTVPRPMLQRYEQEAPALRPAIHCLLRHWEGIYDGYVPVSETRAAQLMGTTEAECIRQWQELRRFGILDYLPSSDKPQIRFLQERIVVDQLRVDVARIGSAREAFGRRLEAMHAYAVNDTACRSRLLLAYFGEEDGPDCGICDVCRARKKSADESSMP